MASLLGRWQRQRVDPAAAPSIQNVVARALLNPGDRWSDHRPGQRARAVSTDRLAGLPRWTREGVSGVSAAAAEQHGDWGVRSSSTNYSYELLTRVIDSAVNSSTRIEHNSSNYKRGVPLRELLKRAGP